MAKPATRTKAAPSLEEKLARLKELEDVPLSEALQDAVGESLLDRSNVIVAKGAALARRHHLAACRPGLVKAFHRFMDNPVKTDPGCRAKIAAVEALAALDCPETGLFLHGVHHVQKEPAYGPPVDTAAELRGQSALALLQTGYPEVLFVLADLLADPEPVARAAAARILAATGAEAAELLLRLKVKCGDTEPEVVGECFAALLQLGGERSLDGVAAFLRHPDKAVAQEAALALGGCQSEAAFDRLRQAREETVLHAHRNALLLPMALTRCDRAFYYLLQIVGREDMSSAEAALEALHVLAGDDRRRAEVSDAVRSSGKKTLQRTFHQLFDPT